MTTIMASPAYVFTNRNIVDPQDFDSVQFMFKKIVDDISAYNTSMFNDLNENYDPNCTQYLVTAHKGLLNASQQLYDYLQWNSSMDKARFMDICASNQCENWLIWLLNQLRPEANACNMMNDLYDHSPY